MASAYFEKTAGLTVMQQRLFAAKEPPERYWVDDRTGYVMRTVTRSDPQLPPVSTTMGSMPTDASPHDLRAAADLTWLRLRTRPAPPQGGVVRVVDLFCGCGAMSLGLAEACRALGLQFDAVGAYDIDPGALRVYGANFGVAPSAPVDLATVLQADLEAEPSAEERAMVEQAGEVHGALAGPPCQGHSTLNNRTRHTDPKNALYFLIARFAKLFTPRWIIVENVPTVRQDRSRVVQRTVDSLDALGYSVAEGIADLWSIGVPQTRRRHVLVAARSDQRSLQSREIADLVVPYATRARAVQWAIEDLLDAPKGSPLDRVKTPDPQNQVRIDYLFDNNLYDLPDRMRPDCHRYKEHTYQSVYGRMKWNEPAPTITSGFETMGRGRFVHPRRRRTLTAREAARLQFLPDYVDFAGISERATLDRLIGNAVPPKLSYVLGLELLR